MSTLFLCLHAVLDYCRVLGTLEFVSISMASVLQGASTHEIKKQYRELSKIYHPDRPDTGDPVKFMKIAKAYEA